MTEEQLEKLAINWFKQTGYESADGSDMTPCMGDRTPERNNDSQIVLSDRLFKQLQVINPDIPVSVLASLTQKISGPDVLSLIKDNNSFQAVLLNGIEVKYEDEGSSEKSELKTGYIKLIDFSRVNNNQFLVVNQYTIVGSKGKLSPDLVVFINGLPLSVVELEITADEGSKQDGSGFDLSYQKLQAYKEEACGLFLFNEALVVSDGLRANVGALTSSKNVFLPRHMSAGDAGQVKSGFYLETLIRHFFKPALFLDYIYYSIVFDRNMSAVNKTRSVERINKIADCFPSHAMREIDPVAGFTGGSGSIDAAESYKIEMQPFSAELENEGISARAPGSPDMDMLDADVSEDYISSPESFYEDSVSSQFLKEKSVKNPRNVPVWYATNRQPVNINEPDKGFSGHWSKKTTLGSCTVNIPEGHIPGSTGSSWWVRLVKGDDRLRVLSVESLSEEDYWSKLNGAMQDRTDDSKCNGTLFFLHGYNVDFNQAAIRTAQLAYDLKIHPAVFFSWPSSGDVDGYAADEAAIEASYDAIVNYVSRLDQCALSTGSVLHVMAHSMGNRALLKALEAISLGITDERTDTRTAIDKLVFAAPDVDARVFMQSLNKIVVPDMRKTLYASQKDKVVWASKLIHKYARAGFLPPVTIVDGVDTIDASGVEGAFLGHTYVASVRALLHDLSSLLKSGLPPSERVGLELIETDEGEIYWKIS